MKKFIFIFICIFQNIINHNNKIDQFKSLIKNNPKKLISSAVIIGSILAIIKFNNKKDDDDKKKEQENMQQKINNKKQIEKKKINLNKILINNNKKLEKEQLNDQQLKDQIINENNNNNNKLKEEQELQKNIKKNKYIILKKHIDETKDFLLKISKINDYLKFIKDDLNNIDSKEDKNRLETEIKNYKQIKENALEEYYKKNNEDIKLANTLNDKILKIDKYIENLKKILKENCDLVQLEEEQKQEINQKIENEIQIYKEKKNILQNLEEINKKEKLKLEQYSKQLLNDEIKKLLNYSIKNQEILQQNNKAFENNQLQLNKIEEEQESVIINNLINYINYEIKKNGLNKNYNKNNNIIFYIQNQIHKDKNKEYIKNFYQYLELKYQLIINGNNYQLSTFPNIKELNIQYKKDILESLLKIINNIKIEEENKKINLTTIDNDIKNIESKNADLEKIINNNNLDQFNQELNEYKEFYKKKLENLKIIKSKKEELDKEFVFDERHKEFKFFKEKIKKLQDFIKNNKEIENIEIVNINLIKNITEKIKNNFNFFGKFNYNFEEVLVYLNSLIDLNKYEDIVELIQYLEKEKTNLNNEIKKEESKELELLKRIEDAKDKKDLRKIKDEDKEKNYKLGELKSFLKNIFYDVDLNEKKINEYIEKLKNKKDIQLNNNTTYRFFNENFIKKIIILLENEFLKLKNDFEKFNEKNENNENSFMFFKKYRLVLKKMKYSNVLSDVTDINDYFYDGVRFDILRKETLDKDLEKNKNNKEEEKNEKLIKEEKNYIKNTKIKDIYKNDFYENKVKELQDKVNNKYSFIKNLYNLKIDLLSFKEKSKYKQYKLSEKEEKIKIVSENLINNFSKVLVQKYNFNTNFLKLVLKEKSQYTERDKKIISKDDEITDNFLIINTNEIFKKITLIIDFLPKFSNLYHDLADFMTYNPLINVNKYWLSVNFKELIENKITNDDFKLVENKKNNNNLNEFKKLIINEFYNILSNENNKDMLLDFNLLKKLKNIEKLMSENNQEYKKELEIINNNIQYLEQLNIFYKNRKNINGKFISFNDYVENIQDKDLVPGQTKINYVIDKFKEENKKFNEKLFNLTKNCVSHTIFRLATFDET